jgi:hypothetical protein
LFTVHTTKFTNGSSGIIHDGQIWAYDTCFLKERIGI